MPRVDSGSHGDNDPGPVSIDFLHEIMELKERVGKLETKVDMLNQAVQLLAQRNQQLVLIIKWVVVPLIIILGGLVGVKIVIP